MNEIVALIAGLAAGGVVVGLVVHFRAKSQTVAAQTQAKSLFDQDVIRGSEMERLRETLGAEQRARVIAETQLVSAQASLDEQKETLDKAKKDLTDAFDALAAKALRGNSEEFLNNAGRALNVVLSDTKGEMGKLVTPLREALTNYEKHVKEIEDKRLEAYSGLTERIQGLGDAEKSLEHKIGDLVQALRSPTARGKWGEMVLDKVLELSGLSEPVIEKQLIIASEDGTVRPDVTIHLPGNREIVIDSKVPLDAYLDAMEASDPATQKRKLSEHASVLRNHMRLLAEKGYSNKLEGSAGYVVLFLPMESLLSKALEANPDLMQEGIQRRVVLATPSTLSVILFTVAHIWQQYKLAENAKSIADAGTVLFDRLCTFVEHLANIGGGLEKARKAYDNAVGSWESRLKPAARKLKELGAAKPDQELPELDGSDGVLRHLPLPEKPAEGGAATS
jgi:DNA recombination protein RmuC